MLEEPCNAVSVLLTDGGVPVASESRSCCCPVRAHIHHLDVDAEPPYRVAVQLAPSCEVHGDAVEE